MITIRRADDRGQADYGWLEARYSFSFANYRDPNHMGFGLLRVLNQDRVNPARGFPPHSHRDMEIVSYVLDGVLEHKDDMGNGSKVLPGEVQVMSAGTGVTHSEYNASDSEDLRLLQMWVIPDEMGVEPRYEQKVFSEAEKRGKLCEVVSGTGEGGALRIYQDARLLVGLLNGDEQFAHDLPSGRMAWIHVASGQLDLNGERLKAGDGAGITDGERLEFTNGDSAEIVLWELPAE